MEARQSFTKSRLTLIALFVTAIMFLLPVGSRAQGIHFGVKGGYNITQMYLGSKIVNTENKNGFFIRIMLDCLLLLTFALGAQLGYFRCRAYRQGRRCVTIFSFG